MNRDLRMRICNSPLIDSQGNINHEYFADVPGAHWSLEDEEKLMQGIQSYGVGNYEKINKKFLPTKNIIEIRLRTCLLLGAHNIEEFKGMKGLAEIVETRNKNLALGKKCGKLKYGVYLN